MTEALNEIFDASNFDDKNEVQVDSILMDKLSKILLQIDLVRQRLAHTVSELLKAAKKSANVAEASSAKKSKNFAEASSAKKVSSK